MASSRSWSQWLRGDTAARAQSVSEQRDAAVAQLRERLGGEEGRLCAQQLVAGGEFGLNGAPSDLTSEPYLRRWLAARDWDVGAAYKSIINHGGWRAHVCPKGYVEEERIQQPLADRKIFLQGCDHEGRALAIIQVRKHLNRTRDLKQTKLFAVYIMDALVNACDRSRNPGCWLSSVFDMTNCSSQNIDVATMTNIMGLLSAHFVERLSVLYFYNPPSIFWALWNASKHLLPEVTRNKIKVIDPSDRSELLAGVPAEVLPVEYGGQAELLPIDEACRRFKLPPFDGRPLGPADAAGTPAAAAAGGSSGGASGSSGDEEGRGDAELVVEDEAPTDKAAEAAAADAGVGAAPAAAAEAVAV